jgi:hypothetical protein
MKDIKKAINMKIISGFNMKPTSTDISEGFERPSFFVDIEGNKKDLGNDSFERNLKIIIYYFPEVEDSQGVAINTTNKLMEVQEKLEEIFDSKLQVMDRFLNIDESKGETIDGILQFSFEIYYIDTKECGESGVMADEIRIRKDV